MLLKRKIGLLIILLALASAFLSGQDTIKLKIISSPSIQETLSDEPIDSLFADTTQALFYAREIVKKLHTRSYLEASADRVVTSDTGLEMYLHIGPVYKIATIETSNISPKLLDKIGFRKHTFEGKDVSAKAVGGLMEDILVYSENHGYPFAEVGLEDVTLTGGSMKAKVALEKGNLYTFGDFILDGKGSISNTYLQKYLGIEQGELYNHKQVMEIGQTIRGIPFLSLMDNPTVQFKGSEASVKLNLDNKRASRFDFLIGILPQSNNGETSFTITGELTADMYNKLGRGEHFFFQFQRLRPETQELDLAFNYPYLLDLPFGIDIKFRLFRNADAYLELDFDAGMQYLFTGNDYFKFFFNLNSLRLLDIDTMAISQAGILPNQLDINFNNAGVEFQLDQLDYKFNPRSGYFFSINTAAGFKKIIKNNQILAIGGRDFNALYDTLDLNSFQFNLKAEADYFLPLGPRSTLKSSVSSAIKVSGEQIFQNELFRIGGYQLLRGFDEESVLARFFSIFTLEYRLLLSQNSYLAGFIDYGVINNPFQEEAWDRPYGFGMGLNFETSSGLFGLSAAIGSQLGNPINFRNTKIHFGYVNLF